MPDDKDQKINALALEIDRLSGQVAALSAYVAMTGPPPAHMESIRTAAKAMSPPRSSSGRIGAPTDPADDHVKKLDELAKHQYGL